MFLKGALLLCCMLATEYATTQPIGALLSPPYQAVSAGNDARLLLVDQTSHTTSYYVAGALSTAPSLSLFGRRLGISGDMFTLLTLAYANSAYFINFHGIIGPHRVVRVGVSVPAASFLRGITMYFVAVTWNINRAPRLHVSPVAVVSIL